MYLDLRDQVNSAINGLNGQWVKRNSGYDQDACAALGFKCNTGRYADASWGAYSIELKKGTSIWIDIVRYSEILLHHPEFNSDSAVTLFLVPTKSKDKIWKVICVPTSKLVLKFGLDKDYAKIILAIRGLMPRQLNAQASLTISDVEGMSVFTCHSS